MSDFGWLIYKCSLHQSPMNKGEFSTLENWLFPGLRETQEGRTFNWILSEDCMNKHMLLNKRLKNNFPLCLWDSLAASKLFTGNVLAHVLGNAAQEWIVGIVQTGLMTMTVRLWMLLCLPHHARMETGTCQTWPNTAKDHAKAWSQDKAMHWSHNYTDRVCRSVGH